MADEDIYQSSLQCWTPELAKQADIVASITSALALLGQKRVTLEEKLIRKYLHSLAVQCGVVISAINQLLEEQPEKLHSEILEQLQGLDDEILAALKDLIKMTNYDLNFLEQYYEHGFFSRIDNDSRLLARMQEIASRLGAEHAGSS